MLHAERFLLLKWRRNFLMPWGFLVCFIFMISSAQKSNTLEQQEQAIRGEITKNIIGYMNPTAEPCQDFFEYACGRWAEYFQPKGEDDIMTQQSEMELLVKKDMQSILKNRPTRSSSKAEQEVYDFYQSCATVSNTSPEQQTYMRNLIRKFGGLPTLPQTNWQDGKQNWLDILAQLRRDYGFNILIAFEIDKSMDPQRQTSIYLGEPSTTIIPMENCSAVVTETTSFRDEAYEKLKEEIAENMQKWVSMEASAARLFAHDVVGFEFELCKKMRIDESLPVEEEPDEMNMNDSRRRKKPINNTGRSRVLGKRNIGDLPRHTLHELTNFGDAIDFKRYVTQIVQLPLSEMVYIRAKTYLKHLAYLIKTAPEPKTTLLNYIFYRVLSELNFPINDNPIRHAQRCIELVQQLFPKIAGYLYQEQYKRPELAEDIQTYFDDIKDALNENLENNHPIISTMDQRTAHQTINQFEALFPNYENLEPHDLPLERQNYWIKLDKIMVHNAGKNLQRISNVYRDASYANIEAYDVRAKLMPSNKKIYIGRALLQQPFYSYHYPQNLKFASLGQNLARELVMAFDEQGWTSPTGEARLEEYTKQGLHNQTECYRTQYSSYLNSSPDEFRNTTRLREIIADSNGLNIAFNAYLTWLKKTKVPARLRKETLPQINFTNTQLFFIHFAQTRCFAKFEDSPLPDYFPSAKQIPERYDVNGPLSNFVEFAREFHCLPGDPMNPGDKCGIYYSDNGGLNEMEEKRNYG